MPIPASPRRNILVIDTTAVASNALVGKAAQFSTPTIQALRAAGHNVQILTYVPPAEVLKAADVVWSEWCNEAAYELAASGLCRRLVIRVRGFDVWTPLHQMQWNNVYAVVHESVYLKQVFGEVLAHLKGKLPSTVAQHVIPAGIDLTRFTFQEPSLSNITPVIAVVARATPSKGQQLIYEWARQTPWVQIHMTTALGEYDDRFMRYLEAKAIKPPNVHLHGTVDTPVWLRKIGAQYLLSASMYESLSYAVIEAMAMGLVPLIHAAPNNSINWPTLPTWTTLDELTSQLNHTLLSPKPAIRAAHAWRAMVERDYDGDKQAEVFANVLFEGLTDTPAEAAVELVSIKGNEAEAIEAMLASDALIDAIHVFQNWRPTAEEHVRYVRCALDMAKMAHIEGELAIATRLAFYALELQIDAEAFDLLGKIADAQGDRERAKRWFQLAAN